MAHFWNNLHQVDIFREIETILGSSIILVGESLVAIGWFGLLCLTPLVYHIMLHRVPLASTLKIERLEI
jgi:hypothetical protein